MSKLVDHILFARKRREPKGVRDTSWLVKHNMSETSLYYAWLAMKQRCYNKNNPKYRIYGAKGIKVCAEWKDNFCAFVDWALKNGYGVNLTIDRIDGDGDYCPDNCRFVSYEVQANNTSRNVFVEYNGEKKSVSQWAKRLGINVSTLQRRFYKGWSIEKALTTPVDSFYRRNYKK